MTHFHIRDRSIRFMRGRLVELVLALALSACLAAPAYISFADEVRESLVHSLDGSANRAHARASTQLAVEPVGTNAFAEDAKRLELSAAKDARADAKASAIEAKKEYTKAEAAASKAEADEEAACKSRGLCGHAAHTASRHQVHTRASIKLAAEGALMPGGAPRATMALHAAPLTMALLGEEALTAAGGEDGALTTPSGLVLVMEREGTGASPTATDTVEVNYEGKLVDGTVFDSSYTRGETLTFNLGYVIKGWAEGLQLMKPGGKAKLTIPYELAYGENGSPPGIPPRAVLTFTVELLDVVPIR